MTECASPIIDEIRRLVMQYAADKTGPQIESPIDGLFFSVRYGSTGTCTCSVYEPSVALMLQGRKMTTAGTRVYTYGRGDLLITSMDVPTTYQVLEASPDKPFVGIGIRIDAVVMTDLIRQLPLDILGILEPDLTIGALYLVHHIPAQGAAILRRIPEVGGDGVRHDALLHRALEENAVGAVGAVRDDPAQRCHQCVREILGNILRAEIAHIKA